LGDRHAGEAEDGVRIRLVPVPRPSLQEVGNYDLASLARQLRRYTDRTEVIHQAADWLGRTLAALPGTLPSNFQQEVRWWRLVDFGDEFPRGPSAGHGLTPASVDLEVGHLLSFASGTSATVELETKLRLRYGEAPGSEDSVEARVSWLHLQGLGLPSFLAGALAGPGGRPVIGELRHAERLAVDIQGASGGTQGGAVAVVARHETVLSYADLGFLKGSLGAGIDVRAVDGVLAPGFGVEAAIEIELRF
jgi:hypothetical protein